MQSENTVEWRAVVERSRAEQDVISSPSGTGVVFGSHSRQCINWSRELSCNYAVLLCRLIIGEHRDMGTWQRMAWDLSNERVASLAPLPTNEPEAIPPSMAVLANQA